MKKHWKIFRKNSMEIFRNFPEKYEIFRTNFSPHITRTVCIYFDCSRVLSPFLFSPTFVISDLLVILIIFTIIIFVIIIIITYDVILVIIRLCGSLTLSSGTSAQLMLISINMRMTFSVTTVTSSILLFLGFAFICICLYHLSPWKLLLHQYFLYLILSYQWSCLLHTLDMQQCLNNKLNNMHPWTCMYVCMFVCAHS